MDRQAEGKTKLIFDAGNGQVILFSKDDITSGDGSRRDVIEGKGAVATRTTANVFGLLNRHGIPTHFLRQVDDRRLLCLACHMIPLEVTIRGTAAGHYLKRNLSVEEGIDLPDPVVEFTFKDDARHDPLVVISDEGGWQLYDAALPVAPDTLLGEIRALLSPQEVTQVRETARQVFGVLRQAWAELGAKLVDLKIEFGRTDDGRIVVGDVVDNDSWRLWPGGDKGRQLDKQIYREGGGLDEVLESYRLVAQMTERF
jgi:phosphoribosylaminoimidazole-succinocarboxamide synthase